MLLKKFHLPLKLLCPHLPGATATGVFTLVQLNILVYIVMHIMVRVPQELTGAITGAT